MALFHWLLGVVEVFRFSLYGPSSLCPSNVTNNLLNANKIRLN